MTEHRTSNVSTGSATIPPATAIGREGGTRLLKKVHAIRPLFADRDGRKKLDKVPAIPPSI